MSKLTDNLRRLKIVNAHEFYAGRPYISHYAPTGYRDVSAAAWLVTCPGEDLSVRQNGSGSRRFLHHGGIKSESSQQALAEAQAWASERFGIEAWAKDPFGHYGDAAYVEARLAELRPQIAALGPAPLPVYSWRSSRRDFGQVRMLCAAPSKAAALRAADEHRSDDVSETGNPEDCEFARAHPGEAFFKPMRGERGYAWLAHASGEPVE